MHSAVVLSPPGAGAVDAVPPGTGSFLAATADELVTWEASRSVRLYESAVILEQTPIFDTVAPRTFGLGGRLGVERPWEGNALGVETRADYTAITGSLNVDGTPAGEQRQIVGTGVGFWRHDWGRYFTSRTEGGALRVQRLNTGHGFWEPTGLAALAYVMEYGDAELTADHTVRTNPLIGQSLIVNEVQLRGALPITQKGEILVGLSSGYQNGQILDETAEVAAHVDAVLVDAGVGWQATKSLLVGLRYQHYEQVSDTRVPPLPLSFVRNSVILGAAFLYPPDSEMPRQYRAPLRVDRTDEIRDTTEPAPEPRTQPGGAGAGT
jgi:hypothetical protein